MTQMAGCWGVRGYVYDAAGSVVALGDVRTDQQVDGPGVNPALRGRRIAGLPRASRNVRRYGRAWHEPRVARRVY